MMQRPGTRRLRRQSSRFLAALSIYSLGIAVSLWTAGGRAESVPELPLAAMRAAAQNAADTEPDPTQLTRKLPPPPAKVGSDALSAAIRAVVRDEASRAAREGTLAAGRSGSTPAASNSNGNGNGNGNGDGNAASDRHGPSDTGQLHSALTSAQQAKHNVAVQNQHQGGVGALGNSAATGHLSLPGAGEKR